MTMSQTNQLELNATVQMPNLLQSNAAFIL